MEAYAATPDDAAFARSRDRFESVIEMLSAPDTGRLTHAELEEELTTRSRELFRTLFQDHLDLRAAREERAQAVTGVDGIRRGRVEHGHKRGLTCVFGPVTVERLAYRAPGYPNVYPADAVLNLPKRAHSHGLRRLAALESTRGSFTDAATAIERTCGVRVGKRQVAELACAAAVHVDWFYQNRCPAPGEDGDLVVLFRRQGRGAAPGRTAAGHRPGRRRGTHEAGHPAVTGRETRPQADGRDRSRLPGHPGAP
jgi:hypothetical protein